MRLDGISMVRFLVGDGGKDSQLGSIENLDKRTRYIQQIQMLSLPQKIIQIECGRKHSLLRGQDGTSTALVQTNMARSLKEMTNKATS
jgi:hypothetical protein